MEPMLKAEAITATLWKEAARLFADELRRSPNGQASIEAVLRTLQSLVQHLDQQMFANEPQDRVDAALLAFLRDVDGLLGQ